MGLFWLLAWLVFLPAFPPNGPKHSPIWFTTHKAISLQICANTMCWSAVRLLLLHYFPISEVELNKPLKNLTMLPKKQASLKVFRNMKTEVAVLCSQNTETGTMCWPLDCYLWESVHKPNSTYVHGIFHTSL